MSRYETRAIVNQLAHRTPVKEVVGFSREDALDKFTGFASRNRAVALGVKSLHINLRSALRSLRPLRQCLSLLKNVEDLELRLVGHPPSGWTPLFRALRYTRIKNISTNAPHEALAHFLLEHPDLLHFQILGDCNTAGECPMAESPLPMLSDVVAPTSCIAAVVKGNPVERVSAVEGGQTYTFPQLVKALATTTAVLTTLHLDFDPGEQDILQRLSGATPHLTALKLVEKTDPTNGRGGRLCRPWRAASKWGAELMGFPNLHRFLLRTSVPLINGPDVMERESALIAQWTTVTMHRIYVPHPRLAHITLWHLADSPDGVLQWWERDHEDRRWKLGGRAVPPTWEQFI
ncbi:hypothetical protein BU15DRAFT_82013 [Melanogaster broomeanus]|nr:hypothetical protein BU15DRAFT_82013 [Melanogaster broomeanus]